MSFADQQWYPTSVQVTVLQARCLRIKGKSGTNDAYAVMQVGKEKYQTSVVEKSVAPVWREEATFDLPQGAGGRGTLHVHVLHRALVGPDKHLGQAVVDLLRLSEDKTRNKTEWFKLVDKTEKADKDRGEVLLDIQFMRNQMTASMFDLSAAGKSRSRLGKFKDKVRGKKKESDSVSSVVPSFAQVLTDSEEEANNEDAAGKDEEKKKKHKMKSLFSAKSNLQRNMSQSMTVLPGKNSSLSRSQSSGLNVDSSEGKKKFKFKIHKRLGSSDGKDSSGHQKHGGAGEQSNLCINGSHVYCDGSNFSLASSGHGSMEDVPESSPPSANSLNAVRQYSPWTEEEEEETAEVENIMEDVDEVNISLEKEKRNKEERLRVQEEALENWAEEKRREEEMKRTKEEKVRWEEEERAGREEEGERERLAAEKRRLEEQERKRIEEEMEREEKFKKEVERRRLEEERQLAEEKRRKEEEKRAEEEKIRKEEEERIFREEEWRRQEEERERERLAEEKRRLEEQERKRIEEEMQREEEERMRMEEERRKEEEREREQLAEEKRRLEEQERKRIEEERIRMEEERRQEEERNLAEENRRLEKRRAEEDKVRKDEERRRKEKEERLRREEEEREMKRKLEEQERRWQEEREKNRKEEEKRLEEEERAREEKEKYERLVKDEKERERIEAEEKIKREVEERITMEEERKREQEREEKERLEEQERRRIEEEEKGQRQEEERRRQEEKDRVKKEKEEFERLIEEKRRLEEQERRCKEEERIRKEEQDKMRMEVERKRREDRELERLAEEKRSQEEQEQHRIEEETIQREGEQRFRRMEKEEEEARRLTKKLAEEQTNRSKSKQGHTSAMERSAAAVHRTAAVASTNPFDENFPNNSFEDIPHSPTEADSNTTMSSIQQGCQPAVSLAGGKSISTDEKNLINAQREKRPAPPPPGRNIAESQREPDVASQHLAQNNKQSNDKDIKTASVLPQRSVQLIAPLSQSCTDAKTTQNFIQSSATKGTASVGKHSKRPAPSTPCSAEEEPSSESKKVLSSNGKLSQGSGSKTKQAPACGLNPFEDDEDEVTLQDDTTAPGNTSSTQWPPPVSHATDEAKLKSSKMTHAPPPPPPPASKPSLSTTLIHQNSDTCHAMDTPSVPALDKDANQACGPQPEATLSIQNTSLKEPQPARSQSTVEVTGVKKEAPPTSSRRLLPVRPLNPLEQQSVAIIQGGKSNKSKGIVSDIQEKTKITDDSGLKGAYSQLTREELVSLVLKQENQLSERDKKISDLEKYIDNLLVRVIEEKPSILMSMNSLK